MERCASMETNLKVSVPGCDSLEGAWTEDSSPGAEEFHWDARILGSLGTCTIILGEPRAAFLSSATFIVASRAFLQRFLFLVMLREEEEGSKEGQGESVLIA